MLRSPVHKVSEFVAHATNANCVTIGPKTGSILATGGDDKKVNVWRVGSPSSVWSLAGNSAAVECVCFDEEETTVASGSRGGAVKIYDLSEGRLARSLPGHRAAVTSMHHHPFGDFVVTGSIDTNVKIWDVRKKSCIQTYKGHDIDVTAVRFSPDGRWVASAAKNGIFKLWDLTSGRLLHQVSMPRSVHMTNLCFNPAEFILAAATTERVVRLYDMDRFELMGSTNPESGSPVRAMAFDSSGEFLLTATADVVRTWTWEDYEVPNAPKGGERGGGLSSVAGFGGSPMPARLSPGQHGINGIGAAGIGIGAVEPTPGTPAMATSVRCVRSADASWGRVSALWCDPNGSGEGSDDGGGRLVAASCQAQFCAAFEAHLRDLGVEPSAADPPNNDYNVNGDAASHVPSRSTAVVDSAAVNEQQKFEAEGKEHADDDLYRPRIAVKPAYGIDDNYDNHDNDDDQYDVRARDDDKGVKGDERPRDSAKIPGATPAAAAAAEPKSAKNGHDQLLSNEKAGTSGEGEVGSGGWVDTKELQLPPSRDAPRALPFTDLEAKGTGSEEKTNLRVGAGEDKGGDGDDEDDDEYAADWEHASYDDDQQPNAPIVCDAPPPLLPSGDIEESTLPAWMASLSGKQQSPQPQSNEPLGLDRSASPTSSKLRSSNGLRQSSRRGDRPLAWSLKQTGPLIDVDSNDASAAPKPAIDEASIINDDADASVAPAAAAAAPARVASSHDATWQAATARATLRPEGGNFNHGINGSLASSSTPPLDLAALLPSNSRFPTSSQGREEGTEKKNMPAPSRSPPQSPVGAKATQRKHEATMRPADAYRRSLERRDGLLADEESKSNNNVDNTAASSGSGVGSGMGEKGPKVPALPEWISPARPPLSGPAPPIVSNGERRGSGGSKTTAAAGERAGAGIDPLKVFGIGTRTPRDAGTGPTPRRSPRASPVTANPAGGRGSAGGASRCNRGTTASSSSSMGPRSSPLGHSGMPLRAGAAPSSDAKVARNVATPRQETPLQSTPSQRSPPRSRMDDSPSGDAVDQARLGSSRPSSSSSYNLDQTRQAVTLQRVPTDNSNGAVSRNVVGTGAWVDVSPPVSRPLSSNRNGRHRNGNADDGVDGSGDHMHEEKDASAMAPPHCPLAVPDTPHDIDANILRRRGSSNASTPASTTLGLSGTFEGLINPPPRPAPPLPASPEVSNLLQGSPTRISPPPAQSPPSTSSARRFSPVYSKFSPSGEGSNANANREPPTDDAIIAELLGGYNAVESALSHRLAHLKVVGSKWRLGDGSGSMQHLHEFAESSNLPRPDRDLVLAVLSDFLGAADLIAGGRAGVLAVADATMLLPLLASAFDAASQHQASARSSSSASSPNRIKTNNSSDLVSKRIAFRAAAASARAASALLTLFGATVRENTSNSSTASSSSSSSGAASSSQGPTLSHLPAGPVDVSADERRARCHRCKKVLKACVTSATTLRHMLPRRPSSTVKAPNAGRASSSSDEDAGLIAALSGFLEEYEAAFSP